MMKEEKKKREEKIIVFVNMCSSLSEH